MSSFEQSSFCRETCTGIVQKDGYKIYSIKCADGAGTVISYEVFPGVELLFQDFTAHSCLEKNDKSAAMQINFCLAGRFEWDYSERDCYILGPGDISVHRFDGNIGDKAYCEFPLGYYHGAGLFIDCEIATSWARDNLGQLAMDFFDIKSKLLPDKWCWIRAASEESERIFRELSDNINNTSELYVRVKVIELLLHLLEMPALPEKEQYFPKEQVELIKRLRDEIVRDSSNYSTIDKLAGENGVSATQLQKVFKAVYGVPIYTYLREYRMEQAAVDLIKTSKKVTEIAMDAGFSNPGKFSEAFKRRYGETPTNYRMSSRNKNRNGVVLPK